VAKQHGKTATIFRLEGASRVDENLNNAKRLYRMLMSLPFFKI
jgi:hypothetical protein